MAATTAPAVFPLASGVGAETQLSPADRSTYSETWITQDPISHSRLLAGSNIVSGRSMASFRRSDSGRTWTYGDSVSRGKNMRLDAQVRLSSGGAGGVILTALYAGAKQIRSEPAEYKKANWMVMQKSGEDWAPILRYPFRKGQTWHARRDKEDLFYTIVEDDARIKTVAGVFENCLKVREANPKFKGSWKYDYYAPFVGRVATTIAGPGFENPNTELIKFSR